MNISKIEMRGFMAHHSTAVVLPERGLVLVTGPNGAGKSGIVEAVATAFWGKTLRGASPWAGDGDATVASSIATASRMHKGTKTRLDWRVGDEAAKSYENPTKAQEALEQVVGPFEVWRRTHVFSSQDAAHFTLSTDAERKRLLEALLGLERFDTALSRCRVDLKKAESEVRAAEVTLGKAQAYLEMQRKRVSDAREVLERLPPEVSEKSAAAKLTALKQMVSAASADVVEERKKIREIDSAAAVLEAQARETARRMQSLDTDTCDRCGQAIPKVLRQQLHEHVVKDQTAAVAARAESAQKVRELQEHIEELESEKAAIEKKIQTLVRDIEVSHSYAVQRDAAEKSLEGAEALLSKNESAVAENRVALGQHQSRLDTLTAAETVLGFKGVRAHVLGKALSGLEAASNAWLTRIAGRGFKVSLSPYTEKKTGGVADSISLEVAGAGGGHGYKASSGGERRRIDVALLLALAEVAGASHGRVPGTLFFDEVFDALDDDGVDAVRDALVELSQERAVVVVTHSKSLADRLPAALHLRIKGGNVS